MNRSSRLRKAPKIRSGRSKAQPVRDIKLWRVRVVRVGVSLICFVIILRLVQIQVFEHQKYKKLADIQYNFKYIKKAQRGLLLDRNGNELALNKPRYELGLDKKMAGDLKKVTRKLAGLLKRSEREISNIMRKDDRFVYIERRLYEEQAALIKMSNIPGVKIIEASERMYPLKDKLAQVIGFVDIDGRGLSGIEKEYDRYLKGEDGKSIFQRDAMGRTIVPVDHAENKNGDDVVLTIDHIIQTIAEEELSDVVSQYNAKGGCVVILEPFSGEILAMASSPGFDANRATAYKPENWRIRPITDIFEPGSTFKVITMTAALADSIKKLNDIVFCENGQYRLYGETIKDPEKFAWLSVENALKHSSNIGMAKIAMDVGKDRIFRTARDFGFGNETGIGLPGEVPGILKKPRDWSRFSIAAIAYGHEVAVTALQMAMAYGAIANGGLLMKPGIVRGIKAKDGKIISQFEPQSIRRVMNPEIAQKLTRVLEGVVKSGTGQMAGIADLRIAGKTGTAQKPLTDQSGYSDSKFVASFVGFYPAERAKYLIYVMIDAPYPVHSGGNVAAPTFRKILERILKVYDKSKLEPRRFFAQAKRDLENNLVPDLKGRRIDAAEKILTDLEIKYELRGQGSIVQNQQLQEDARKNRQPVVVLTLQNFPDSEDYRVVPDLIGLPMRRALAELTIRGLQVKTMGSGIVRRQDPEAGSKIRVGARCVLELTPNSRLSHLVQR